MKKFSILLVILLFLTGAGCTQQANLGKAVDTQPIAKNEKADVTILFPSDKYPETAKHIQEAIAKGKSDICTIDRDSADENREESLDGIPTKKGYDRDEWPMAICAEGGKGADVKYISPKDNRGAGSWVGNQLEDYPDGTKVKFVVK